MSWVSLIFLRTGIGVVCCLILILRKILFSVFIIASQLLLMPAAFLDNEAIRRRANEIIEGFRRSAGECRSACAGPLRWQSAKANHWSRVQC